MSNTNEHLKERFMERYRKIKSAQQFIEDSINMIRDINSESDCTKIIEDFISTAPNYNLSEEDLNEVKEILHEFLSSQMSQNETLAYLNYIYDIKAFTAEHIWFIQDIFKCYF